MQLNMGTKLIHFYLTLSKLYRILIYRSNFKIILKYYVSKARTLRYPPHVCTCQFSEGSLGWLYF